MFENIGAIWDLRLMMDPISGRNRGYCFVTFNERKAAEEAVKQVDSLCFNVYIIYLSHVIIALVVLGDM